MNARDEILARIAVALDGAEPVPAPARAAPAPGAAAGADLADLFAERVADYRAVVHRVGPHDVATAVGAALAPARTVVVPPGLPTSWLPPGAVRVTDDGTFDAARLDRIDAVVTASALGIATTGTIVLDHGPDQGRRLLTLVPDLHVCIVREADLVADVPDAMARLAGADRAHQVSTWISGPSATSDIELERVEGVHGPRTLHVILTAG